MSTVVDICGTIAERRSIGKEERSKFAHFLWTSEPLLRNRGSHHGEGGTVVRKRFQQCCLSKPRGYCIDANARPGEFDCRRLGDSDDCMFAGNVRH